MRSLLPLASALMLALAPVRAGAETAVDLELVLTNDVSRSIDSFEHRLQREGYARALNDPDVVAAITSGPKGRIALTYVEWSGSSEQATLVDWMIIDGKEAASKFASAVLEAPRAFFGSTSVSGAIDYAVRQFGRNGIKGVRRVIDVSGDGPNNNGRPSYAARDNAVRAGITINGLAILNDRPSRPPWPEQPVDEHYREQVIGGPGAFVLVVKGFESFGEGIRQKLLREVAEWPGATRAGNLPRERRSGG